MSAPLSPKLSWELMNPILASVLNPILANPILGGVQITNIVMPAPGPPDFVFSSVTFNHNLGRMMRGWFITDINFSGGIYRTEPFNTNTLTLTAESAGTFSVWCY